MKLFESIVRQKKQKGDKSPEKVRPILVVAVNVTDAKSKLQTYWGDEYKIGKPNMIADFNPK